MCGQRTKVHTFCCILSYLREAKIKRNVLIYVFRGNKEVVKNEDFEFMRVLFNVFLNVWNLE